MEDLREKIKRILKENTKEMYIERLRHCGIIIKSKVMNIKKQKTKEV